MQKGGFNKKDQRKGLIFYLFIYLLGEFVQLTKTVIKVYTNKKK